ncbi:MAG: glycosyltransferase family 2 protein [Patescibacteria group bacterium]
MIDLEIPWADERNRTYRFFEILPGLLSYLILVAPIVISVFNTAIAAYFLISYVLIWVMKSAAMSRRVFEGHSRIKQTAALDWEQMLTDISEPALAIDRLDGQKPINKFHAAHIRILESLKTRELGIYPNEVHHAVMIATYNEPPEIVEPTIKYILESTGFDKKRISLFIAYEARAGIQKAKETKELVSKYKKHFMHAEAVEHVLQKNEIPGKGSNANWAGRRIQAWSKSKKLKPSKVLVTVLDADNRPDVNYLACLTYTYCLAENRKQKSYQPVAMYVNNVWDVPAIARISAIANTYFHTANSMRLHALRNFSAHAQSLDALIDTNFWSGRTIVEDGHQFWRTYIRYRGDHEVLPLYAPIYQDAVYVGSYRKTMIAQFKQIRRWTYGASDVAYLATKVLKNKDIPRLDALFKFGRLLEGHVGWATSAPLIFLSGWIPLVFAIDSSDNIVAQQLPNIIARINSFALILLFVVMYIGMVTLPNRPKRYTRFRYLAFIWQWLFMPISATVFNSFASLSTQTRLIFGLYLERFDVTEKAIKE